MADYKPGQDEYVAYRRLMTVLWDLLLGVTAVAVLGVTVTMGVLVAVGRWGDALMVPVFLAVPAGLILIGRSARGLWR